MQHWNQSLYIQNLEQKMIQTENSNISHSLTTISIKHEIPATNLSQELARHHLRHQLSSEKLKKINTLHQNKKKFCTKIKQINQMRINASKELERQNSNRKKFELANRTLLQHNKPYRVCLSNVSNLEELRGYFNCSRAKLKGKSVKFIRQVHRKYNNQDNIDRQIKKGALGDNFVLF